MSDRESLAFDALYERQGIENERRAAEARLNGPPSFCAVCSKALYHGPYEDTWYQCEECDAPLCDEHTLPHPADDSCAICPACHAAQGEKIKEELRLRQSSLRKLKGARDSFLRHGPDFGESPARRNHKL